MVPRRGDGSPAGNRVSSVALCSLLGVDYNRPLRNLDADPRHRTDAHGYGVSVSQIAVMVAGVAKPVRDRRMTISRTVLMLSPHTLLTRYEDVDGRSGCAHRRRMHPVPSQRGYTSVQRTQVAVILTTRVHPGRRGGTGAAADRSDVES